MRLCIVISNVNVVRRQKQRERHRQTDRQTETERDVGLFAIYIYRERERERSSEHISVSDSSVQPTQPPCRDLNPNCVVWGQYYCNKPANAAFMARNCKKSCNLCGPGGSKYGLVMSQ